ncbi:MAG: sigma-70 family RNA polymerase sigma factor [Betaproteobacteria bacterium]|nr:sigma-70 family RNA polymerase sigma factor [Betaproteobacteria bacterium]MDE2623333.1 sigma-70 family RNA polymerase sigma factor [Betaproteobacteria bacterium]
MEHDLAALRSDLLKFARLQLRDEALAEDAVQETLAAALSGLSRFKERAQMKTWVIAILKNKIVDILRDRARNPQAFAAVEEIPEDAYDDLFDERGHWREEASPTAWGNPEASLKNRQFWEVLEICLTRLPEKTARVFLMREVLGLETEEICKELALSSTNCMVVLHRARMGLRLCLDDRWFHGETRNA